MPHRVPHEWRRFKWWHHTRMQTWPYFSRSLQRAHNKTSDCELVPVTPTLTRQRQPNGDSTGGAFFKKKIIMINKQERENMSEGWSLAFAPLRVSEHSEEDFTKTACLIGWGAEEIPLRSRLNRAVFLCVASSVTSLQTCCHGPGPMFSTLQG